MVPSQEEIGFNKYISYEFCHRFGCCILTTDTYERRTQAEFGMERAQRRFLMGVFFRRVILTTDSIGFLLAVRSATV